MWSKAEDGKIVYSTFKVIKICCETCRKKHVMVLREFIDVRKNGSRDDGIGAKELSRVG